MTDSEFRLIFDDQVVKCSKTLCNKRKEYTGDHQDRLIAFKVAASSTKSACRYDGQAHRILI